MKTWKEQLQIAIGHAKAAKVISDKAGSQMTATERKEYDAERRKAYDAKVESDRLKKDADDTAFLTKITGDGNGTDYGDDGDPLSGLSLGTKGASRWAKSAAAAIAKTAKATGAKAITTGAIDTPAVLETDVAAIPKAPRRLVDLMIDRQPLDSNAFFFIRQVTRDNNAAAVADSATKPTSVFTVEPVEDRARVVAHLSEPVPERLFEDHDELVRWLDSEMREGVLDELERLVLAGTGTGEEPIGLLTTTGVINVAFATDAITTIRKTVTDRQNRGIVPTAWALNPADAEMFDLLKDAEQRFYGGALDNLFGTVEGRPIPRIPVPGVPAGTAILGDWKRIKLGIRHDVRLAADRSGADLFDKNLVKLRAEGRFGIGTTMPVSFAIADLTAA